MRGMTPEKALEDAIAAQDALNRAKAKRDAALYLALSLGCTPYRISHEMREALGNKIALTTEAIRRRKIGWLSGSDKPQSGAP
jgi:hypothetical protein